MGQDIKYAVPQVMFVVISFGIYDRDCQRNHKVHGKGAGIKETDDAVDRSVRGSIR